jgi:hypothetical protein
MGGPRGRERIFCLWRTKAKNISLERAGAYLKNALARFAGGSANPKNPASRTSRPPILPVKNLEPRSAAIRGHAVQLRRSRLHGFSR